MRPYNKIVVKDESFVISEFPYKLLKYGKTASITAWADIFSLIEILIPRYAY